MFSLYLIYLFYFLFSINYPARVLYFSLFIQNLSFISTTQSVGHVTPALRSCNFVRGGKALLGNIFVLASKRRNCFSSLTSPCAKLKAGGARRLLLGLGYKKQLFSTSSFYRAKDKVLSVATNNIKIRVMLDNEVELSDSNKVSIEDLKDLHSAYIKVLFIDRNAPVKSFDRALIATCYHCLDKDKRSDFLKQ